MNERSSALFIFAFYLFHFDFFQNIPNPSGSKDVLTVNLS
jgi:hypothetical protein